MPSKYSSLFKSNRSQASLPLQSAQEPKTYPASTIQTPLHSPAFAPPPPSPGAAYAQGEENNNYARPLVSDEARIHRQSVPARSQSQRSPPSSFSGPTIQLVGPSPRSIESPSSDEDPHTSYKPAPPVPAQKEDQKRSKRSFFGIGPSTSAREPVNRVPPSGQRGLDRSVSVRRKAPAPQISTNVESHQTQQRWPLGPSPSTYSPPVGDEEVQSGVRIEAVSPELSSGVPAVPAKDPVRAPQQRFSLQQDQYHGQIPSQQRVNSDPSHRQPPDQQGGRENPARERGAALSYQFQQPQSQQHSQYQTFHPSPISTTSTSSHPLPLRGAHDLLQQPNSEIQISRPPSQQSIDPVSQQPYDPPSPTLQSTPPPPPHAQGLMGPPPGQPPQNRGSMESGHQKNTQAGVPREGSSYQSYGQGPSHGTQLAVNSQQGGNYRGPAPPPPPMAPSVPGEQGRSTPPPSRSRDDLAGLDMAQLLARHDELQEKYRKVKKYYFDKDAQVQQLQNTLAHQRLAQSHTSLDDSEYTTRFNRLDGAINQLSFNNRKDWRSVPPWLSPHVNKDAPLAGTKEMTAVGRACMTRWLVDEILDRYFHPALEPNLSIQLKIIEKNFRRFAPPTPSDEEKDALLVRIANWRLATLDGLQEMLCSPQAGEYRSALTGNLIEKLIAHLEKYLKQPAPPGLEGGVSMIVELAVGIAANLPLESRDVFVEYVLPGTVINETYMKVDGALPALTNPGEGPSIDVNDKASIASLEEKDGACGEADRESLKEREQGVGKKKTMFGGLIAKKNAPAEKDGTRGGVGGQGQQVAPKEERVRFAVFMAAEVRGRSVLIKAPVYI